MTDGTRLETEFARDSKGTLVYDGGKNLISSPGLVLPYYCYECHCSYDCGTFLSLFIFIAAVPVIGMSFLFTYYLLCAITSTIYAAFYYKLCTRPVSIIILACSSCRTCCRRSYAVRTCGNGVDYTLCAINSRAI